MFCKWIHEFNKFSSREFTRFCEQIRCVHMCFPWNHEFFHVMTRTSETVPVLTQYDSCQTRSKLVTTGRTRVFMWIHMKTRTSRAVPIVNQYGTCQLVQKWFLVCWVSKLFISRNFVIFSVYFGCLSQPSSADRFSWHELEHDSREFLANVSVLCHLTCENQSA